MKPASAGCFLVAACLGSVLSSHSVQRRNDDISTEALAADVTRLAAQVTSLTAEMTAAKNQLTSQQAKLDVLDQTVAFHAVGAGGSVVSLPKSVIKLSSVVTNIGQGLDAQTGYFTAPVSGLYHFHATFMAQNMTVYTHAAIMVDGTDVAISISDSRHGYYDNTAVAAVVRVAAGKRVWLQNVDTFESTYYGGQYLTFSGFLLRAD